MSVLEKFKSINVPELNYAFENSVSFSQYQTYNTCPYQWSLKYIKDLVPHQANIFTIFGNGIHETIQHYLDLLYNKSIEEADELDLEEYFTERFKINYEVEFEKTKTQFTDAKEMGEFFDDAVAILNWFKIYRQHHFATHKFKLLGTELPLLSKIRSSLWFKGYLDIVLYDETEDVIHIYDIKTSTWGWSAKAKKDDSKIAQLLLYKEYLSKQYGIDPDKIEVQFFITRRKLYENSQYAIPRIQVFRPASGKIKRKKTIDKFNIFLQECFGKDGKPIDKEYKKKPSIKNCKFCFFDDKPTICDKNKTKDDKIVIS